MPYSENNMAPYRDSPETRAAIRRNRKRVLKKALKKRSVNSLFKSSVPTYRNGYTQNQKTAK